MKKGLFACSLLGLLAVTLVCLFWGDKDGMRYTYVTQDKAGKMMEKLEPAESALPFSLCFREQALAASEAERTFFLPVDCEDADL